MRIHNLALVCVFGIAQCALSAGAAGPTPAAPAPARTQPLKIAMANPYNIYRMIKETQDLKEKNDQEMKLIENEAGARQNAIKELSAKRAQFAPDQPAFADISMKLDELTANAKAWQEVMQRQQIRLANQRFINTYKKIEAAVAQVSQRENIDLVFSTGPRELPSNLEGMTFNELDTLIASRKIMYSKDIPDISQQVVTLLDAEYAKPTK